MLYEYGQDNEVPSGGSELKDNSDAMSSAEGAVRDKSSDLRSSVESEWTESKASAKQFVQTMKPAAAAFNTVYLTVTNQLPDEVKALFIALPILFFIGWLIGRVRE